MQEGKNGVKRLLGALSRCDNIKALAELLNYYPEQLEQDIEAIDMIEVIEKGEQK